MLNDLTPVARPRTLPRDVTDEHLLEAVGAWLQGEPQEHVAALLHIPPRSLPRVTYTAAWARLAMQWRDEMYKVEAAALTRLTSKAIHRVAERLEKGDVVVGKDGTQYVRPVSAKDAAQIAALFMDRRRDVYRDIDGAPDPTTVDDVKHILEVATALNQRYDITPKKPVLEGVVLIEGDETDDDDEKAA